MSSLIVLLPSSDILAPGDWAETPMAFTLLGRRGETLRCGRARCADLPKAEATVLVVAARDTLLLHAKLPPATGAKLRRVLPNVVEEHLIQDAQRCHIAVGPAASAGMHCLAVIDRDWFAALIDGFVKAGHRRLRAVPLIHCMPLPAMPSTSQVAATSETAVAVETVSLDARQAMQAITGESPPSTDAAPAAVVDGVDGVDGGAGPAIATASSSVLIVQGSRIAGIDATLDPAPVGLADVASAPKQIDGSTWVELALRQGMLGFGISVNAAQLDATLAELAQREPLTLYTLELDISAEASLRPNQHQHQHKGFGVKRLKRPPSMLENAATNAVASAMAVSADSPQSDDSGALPVRTLPLSVVVQAALACRFDLCQFEFANAGRSRAGAGGVKPWRFAIGFVAAALLVSIAALNLQWWRLIQRRDALEQQMTQLVKAVFPGTTAILDPHQQMAAELARMRSSVGELRSSDYLAQAAALAHALGPLPSASIAELNYSDGALDVTFKTDTEIDEDGFKRRLAANGLSAQEDNGKWILKPAPSGTH